MNINLSRHGRSALFVLTSLLVVAVLLVTAGRIDADVVLMEGFQYSNGDLVGLDGGIGYDGSKWTGAWSGPAGEFNVTSQVIRSGWSTAPSETALRQFTSTVAPGTTMYFSTVMNQWGNEGGFEFDWGFTDPNVSLSMYNDQWRLKMGSSTRNTSGAALPATTDFRVVGRLEFDVSGSNDRLTMWAAPTSQSLAESDAHVLQITADCGVNTLGDEFRLRRLGGCDSSKQWDDVRVATDFASVATNAQPSTYLEETFAYSNGHLHGQNGGTATGGASWDTAWTDADYGVGKDYLGVVKDFTVNAEAARMQQSGGANRTIAREFTSNMADGTTVYFSAMMSKPDAEGGYEIAYRFGDANTSLDRGVTVGIANDQYRIRLGSATATAPDKTVTTNRPDLFVGRLEFNADGAAERLSMWTNPNFESDAPDLQLTQDLGTLSLGNLVDLWYGPGSDGIKQWDDLRIGTDFQAATRLRVDVGPNGQTLESGFQAWNVGASGDDVTGVSKDFTQFGGFTARLEKDATGGVDIRDRGSAGGPLDDLKRDGIKEDALRLYFDDLDEGLYELTTYHHDSLDAVGDGMVDIFINDAATPVASVGQTADDLLPGSATFRFTTGTSGSVFLRFVGAETWLDGFELTAINAVPEPSVLLLLGLAGFCLFARRGGRRRLDR